MWTEILQLAMAPILAAANALSPAPPVPEAPRAAQLSIEYDMAK